MIINRLRRILLKLPSIASGHGRYNSTSAINVNDEKFQDYLNRLKNEYEEINVNNSSTKTENERNINFTSEERLNFLQRIARLRSSLEECQKNLHDLDELISTTQNDEEFQKLAKSDKNQLIHRQTQLEANLIESLIPTNYFENYDELELSISPGPGGQEAMLFAKEIFDMYSNYAKYKGWSFQIESFSESDLGGIKHATALIWGTGAFKHLRFEGGIHRVQRVPVTEKTGRIHTSTCSVVVAPQPKQIDIDIPAKDIRVDVCRSSGPGGQNVNRRETAVRITHLPTNTAVECQEERDKMKNFDIAIKRLRSILFREKFDSQMSKLEASRKLQMGNKGRSLKIRTYDYTINLITDHRTKEKFPFLTAALEGQEKFDVIVDSLLNFSRIESLLELLDQKQ